MLLFEVFLFLFSSAFHCLIVILKFPLMNLCVVKCICFQLILFIANLKSKTETETHLLLHSIKK